MLKFGPIQENDFREILDSNFTNLEKKYFTSITTDLEKFNLTNEFVKASLLDGTEISWTIFKANTLKNLADIDYVAHRPNWTNIRLDINIYTLENGELSFTDSDRLRVKEKYCLTFIDSEPKREFLRMTLETLDRLKQLQVILLKNGFFDLFGKDGALFNVLADTEELVFDREVLKYITEI